MSIDYKLSNILGTVYSKGDLIFTPDGRSILSPVGNRISCFDVVNNRSFTFGYEHRQPILSVAINNEGTLMLSVDESGRGILVNFVTKSVLHHMNFKEKVSSVRFSPDGKLIGVCTGRMIQLWKTPQSADERQFASFVRHRVYTGHYSAITGLEWSKDSRFFLTSSEDMTCHIYSAHSGDSGAASTLTGHKDAVIGAYFSENQEVIHSISKDGSHFEWMWSDDEDRWKITSRHYISEHGRVSCTAFHAISNLLIIGFTSGAFGLYELPHCSQLQVLTISQDSVDRITVNQTGEWLLFGSTELGQVLVWEWQSESYILKQQSHYDSLTTVVYSPDGTKVVTGSDDGKIKIWDAVSGFAVTTFNQHMASVSALKFSQRGNVLFSASLDGSVRAWDLLRYRNFRTFTAPKRIQFTSLAVDPSGEMVCAGSIDDFDIHVWNVQTSQLVDRLSGHEGPISSLDFSQDGSLLASGSWDHTARLWNFFGRTAISEPMHLQSEVLVVSFRPDAKILLVSSMDGTITTWNVKSANQESEIDGKLDIGGSGRHAGDRFVAANSARGKFFTSVCYSADGKMILAGGNSKFVCLYDIDHSVLLRKFSISKNMALDGTQDRFNSKNMTEAGPRVLIDHDEADEYINKGIVDDKIRKSWRKTENQAPGSQKGKNCSNRPTIRTSALQFSPTSSAFSVGSTEGLLIYSVDSDTHFDPFELDLDVTIESCLRYLESKEYLHSLVMAFRLGDSKVLSNIFESIPVQDVPLVTKSVPALYLPRLLDHIVTAGKNFPHIEYALLWLRSILESHGRYIAAHKQKLSTSLRAVQRFLIDAKSFTDAAQGNTNMSIAYDLQLSRTNNNVPAEKEDLDMII